MAFYAYRDYERKDVLQAVDATGSDKQLYYFCENPNCSAVLVLNALTSIKIPSYFSSLPTAKHVEGCYAKSISRPFNTKKYNEGLFKLNIIIEEYISNKVNLKTNRLTTLSHLYYMCKSKKILDSYGDSQIWEILCDRRSNRQYSKGIYGSHLVECEFYRFFEDKKTILFKYPFCNLGDNQYILKLIFKDDDKLYTEIKSLVVNWRSISKFPIIIAGDWKKNGNEYTTKITNRNQIHIPGKN